MKSFKLVLIYSLLTSSLLSQGLTISEIMYNSPGEDLEFLEFYNASTEAIDLSGYSIMDAVNYTFPSLLLEPEATFIITNNSAKFQRFYSLSADEWTSGALGNSGEVITVMDANQEIIVYVEYSDNQPWSQMADGGGASLTRCDVNNDINLPESWDRSFDLAGREEGVNIFSSPGTYDGCELGGMAVVTPGALSVEVTEKEGLVVIQYYMDNAPDSTTLFMVRAESQFSAVEGEDFNLLTDTLVFSDVRSSVQNVEIEIIDDGIDENTAEHFNLFLTPLNNTVFVHPEPPYVSIIDCGSETESKLKLRGVIHSSEIKAIELVVLEDMNNAIDYSYAIGSANNGNGSNGQEFQIKLTASASTCVFVTNDTLRFKEFFGPIENNLLIQDEELEADFNGNDAIELFYNCRVVDTYGVADVDGAGEVWDYSDGWAHRAISDGSSPSTFDPDQWEFSGPQALDASTNAASSVPYPFECNILIEDVEEEDLLSINIYPNPSDGIIYIDSEEPLDQLTITNNMGQVIYSAKEKEVDQSINLDAFSHAILFVRGTIGNRSFVKKILLN